MSKQVLISMLKQGSTGSELLAILDVISATDVSDTESPTDQPNPILVAVEF